MQHHTRTLAVLVIALVVAAGCATSQRVSDVPSFPPSGPIVVAPTTPPPAPAVVVAPTTPPVVVTQTPQTVVAAPIPGHPPVDASGVVSSYDPATWIITFADGRIVKLTDGSTVLTASQASTVRPGDVIIVRNALPVAVQSATSIGKRQKVGTVASIDQQNQIVWLTDSTAVRVSPAANVHMNTTGQALGLAQLRPGDQVVIVLRDLAPRVVDVTAAGSALPRDVATGVMDDADEVMVFRASS